MLIAHELAAYRDVLAATLRQLRPHLTILVADPADLPTMQLFVAPRLVIASHAPREPVAADCTWLELYPSGQDHAIIHRGEHQTPVAHIDLDAILALVDTAAHDGDGQPVGEAGP